MTTFLSTILPAASTLAARGARRSLPSLVAALVALATTLSAPAQAYVGPGAGLGVIGTLFGIVAAILLAMFGLLWYPLKRAFAKKGAADGVPSSSTASSDAGPHALSNTEDAGGATDHAVERRDDTAEAGTGATGGKRDEHRPS